MDSVYDMLAHMAQCGHGADRKVGNTGYWSKDIKRNLDHTDRICSYFQGLFYWNAETSFPAASTGFRTLPWNVVNVNKYLLRK